MKILSGFPFSQPATPPVERGARTCHLPYSAPEGVSSYIISPGTLRLTIPCNTAVRAIKEVMSARARVLLDDDDSSTRVQRLPAPLQVTD